MAPTWYIGPMGDLRPMPIPEPPVETAVVRYGGLHQGLSGARRMDITGFRQEFKFNYTYMSRDEWLWLDTLYRRLIPGPFQLLNPMCKNRLVPESSYPQVGGGTARGADLFNGIAVRQPDWPDGVGVGGWSVRWRLRSGQSWFRMARVNPAPVFQEEQVTVSAYVKATGPTTVNWLFDYYNRNGQDGNSPNSADIPVTTEWTRIQHTITVPAAIGAVDPVIRAPFQAEEIQIAAVQLETGDTPTDWEMGGGLSRVVIDQMPTVSPIYPLTDVNLTVLEA